MIPHTVRFGGFEADLSTGELRHKTRRVRLPHQSFVVLAVLVSRPGELITREELRVRVWPEDTSVEYEQGLNAAVNRLRDALGDSATNPRFIETLPRRGYRFIGTLEDQSPAAVDQASPGPRTWRVSRVVPALVAIGLGVGAVVALGTGNSRSGAAALEFSTGSPRPLTSLAGEEIAPSFSPDGSQIAFGWNGGPDGQGFDVFVKPVNSERVLRLTNRPARWVGTAWSPDGSQIAFMRAGQHAGGVFAVPALGGPERRLAEGNASYEPFTQLGWSPDGRRLAYTSMDDGGSHVVRLLSMSDLTSHPVPLTLPCRDAGLPAFSPDGERLALVCLTSVAVYRVHIVTLRTGTSTTLATMQGYPLGLVWNTDGRALIVANDAGDDGRLWSVTMDGELSRLPFGEDGAAPTVAWASGRIAYARSRRNVDVWRVDLTAAESEPPADRLISSSRTDLMARYSPDGARLAFQSTRTGTDAVWVANSDGSSAVRLTTSEGALVGAPSWCSDGRRIAFDSRVSGTAAVYIATIDAGVPRQLQTTEQNLSLPVWSDDCRWILASDGKNALFRIPAGGGPAVRFTKRPSYYAQVSGDRVVFNTKEEDGVRLWARPVLGGDESPIPNMPLLGYDDAWATSPAGIYFTTRADGRTAVYLYEFDSGAARRLRWIDHSPMPLGGLGLSVSPDNRWLLFARADAGESDIMLIDGR